MITPNKITPFSRSVLSKLEVILSERDEDLISLYEATKSKFESIDQFMYALDVLFVLGKIEAIHNTGAIEYAD